MAWSSRPRTATSPCPANTDAASGKSLPAEPGEATFHLDVTVPAEWSAVSIGRLAGKSTADGWTTWQWSESTPVAPYLTTLAVDRFTIERGKLPDGTPLFSAYAPGALDMRSKGYRVAEVLAFLQSRFGPYPQRAAGGIYLDRQSGSRWKPSPGRATPATSACR